MKSTDPLRILLANGWYLDKQQPVSHSLYRHPTKIAPTKTGGISFSFHGSSEVGKGLTSLILKQTGLK